MIIGIGHQACQKAIFYINKNEKSSQILKKPSHCVAYLMFNNEQRIIHRRRVSTLGSGFYKKVQLVLAERIHIFPSHSKRLEEVQMNHLRKKVLF
jgi:hypothetical protein